jgi:hypothetical protein
MEGIARIVSESLARHGFDRPIDYRRLHWSRWFRCESHHSLLVVPSKPGVFALAEEIMNFDSAQAHGAAFESLIATASGTRLPEVAVAEGGRPNADAERREAGAGPARRMLAVSQFFEADDMAFVLDRMLSRRHPMAAKLLSGRYFVRFVMIEDEAQRRSICNALSQWIAGEGEKLSGIGAHFAASLEMTENSVARPANAHATRTSSATVCASSTPEQTGRNGSKPTAPSAAAPQLDSGATTNLHCPSPFPAGF